MIGIFLLLLNNHKKFVDTVKNISFTSDNYSKAKKRGNKYFSDGYGNKFDVNTGHMVERGKDRYTGHRGIIDTKTGRAVEDHIEMQISSLTESYMHNKFPKIKARLDARKECLSKPHKKEDVLHYRVYNNNYVLYWDEETKHYVDNYETCSARNEYPTYNPYRAYHLLNAGIPENIIYEYYRWKGEKIKYPIEVEKPVTSRLF